jgi:hypothetical protein
MPEDALPGSATMADLVMTVKNVSMQGTPPSDKLVYYGMQGAAWLIVYSWRVLGLPVCLVHTEMARYTQCKAPTTLPRSLCFRRVLVHLKFFDLSINQLMLS